jgi:hypothetical protein
MTLWELVFTRDVLYVKDRAYFHSFMGKDQVNGLSFADEGEANIFADRYFKRQTGPPTRKHAPPPPPATNTPPSSIPVGPPIPSSPGNPEGIHS